MTELDKGAVEAVRDLAQARNPIATAYISTPDGVSVPMVAVLNKDRGYEIVNVDAIANPWRTHPKSRVGAATALTLKSFIELVNRHKDDDSVVFADIFADKPSLTAVIDYHKLDGSPRFGTHRIGYAWPISKEWEAWKGADEKPFSQADFAFWLEDHIAELASPTDEEREFFEEKMQTTFGAPNQIAQLSRGLTINVESVVSEANTLQSGEGQIKFEEVHKGADGRPLKVPGVFMLAIPLFFGGETQRVPVRLRYRKAGPKLTWFFQMWQPHIYVHNALEKDLGTVIDDTGLPLYEGSPEK